MLREQISYFNVDLSWIKKETIMTTRNLAPSLANGLFDEYAIELNKKLGQR
jgi:hypothetical protein